MRLSLEQAYKQLHNLFNEYPDLDSASITVKWIDYIRDYEANQVKVTQRAIPQLYSLIHGTHIPYAENDNNVFLPDGKYRISRDKLGDFCTAKKLDAKKVLDVLEGRLFEYEGYRQSWFMGCINTLYVEPRPIAKDEQRETQYTVRVPRHAVAKDVLTEDWN